MGCILELANILPKMNPFQQKGSHLIQGSTCMTGLVNLNHFSAHMILFYSSIEFNLKNYTINSPADRLSTYLTLL